MWQSSVVCGNTFCNIYDESDPRKLLSNFLGSGLLIAALSLSFVTEVLIHARIRELLILHCLGTPR